MMNVKECVEFEMTIYPEYTKQALGIDDLRPILDRLTHTYESRADVWYIRITPGRPVLPPVPDERWASDFPAPDPQTIAELRQALGETP